MTGKYKEENKKTNTQTLLYLYFPENLNKNINQICVYIEINCYMFINIFVILFVSLNNEKERDGRNWLIGNVPTFINTVNNV